MIIFFSYEKDLFKHDDYTRCCLTLSNNTIINHFSVPGFVTNHKEIRALLTSCLLSQQIIARAQLQSISFQNLGAYFHFRIKYIYKQSKQPGQAG